MIIELKMTPIAWARPRRKGNVYFDAQAILKKKAKVLILEQFKSSLIDKPFCLYLDFFLPIPNSYSKKRKLHCLASPHNKKPDLDNLVKFILDSMTGVVFVDDRLIWNLIATKKYSLDPMTLIQINH